MESMQRGEIIEKLRTGLEPNEQVYALWLEGADASNTVDDYSDMDIWVDVADGKEETVLSVIKQLLTNLGSIDFEHEIPHRHPKIRQKFFHLAGTPEFLIIDVCVQSHSRVFWYTKGNEGEKAKILFDKQNVVQFKEVDAKGEEAEIHARAEELEKSFGFFQTWVKKELNRNNFLGAVGYYHEKVLAPLVELLRIQHQPTKRHFGLKHIKSDLPAPTVSQLEELYRVNSVEEIESKLDITNSLFKRTLATLRN